MSLYKKYKKISKLKNRSDKSFNTVKLSQTSKHLIGINGKNHVAILFKASKPKGKEEHIRYLNLEHGIECTIFENKKKKIEKLSIIKLSTNEENLKEIFLRSMDNIVLSLSNKISEKEIYDLTKNIIKLFEKIASKRNIDLIGLWGELFVIKILKAKDLLIEAWHPNPTDPFDFLIKNHALEIKTTQKNDRKHIFKYEQLNSKNIDIIVGSVLIRKSRSGLSLLDLKDDILKKISNEDLKKKLQEMYDIYTGTKTQKELDEVKFNYDYAKDFIKFFDAKKIPRILETPMEGLKNINFESNLNGIENINNFSDYEFLQ